MKRESMLIESCSENSSMRTGQEIIKGVFQKQKEEFNFRQIQDDGTLNFSMDLDKLSHLNSVTLEKQQDDQLQLGLTNYEMEFAKQVKQNVENMSLSKNNETSSAVSSKHRIINQSDTKYLDLKIPNKSSKDRNSSYISNKCQASDSILQNDNSPSKMLKKSGLMNNRGITDSQFSMKKERIEQLQNSLIENPNKMLNKEGILIRQSVSHNPLTKLSFNLQVMVIGKKFIQNLKKRVSSIVFKQITRKQFNIIGDLASYFDYYVYKRDIIKSEILSMGTHSVS